MSAKETVAGNLIVRENLLKLQSVNPNTEVTYRVTIAGEKPRDPKAVVTITRTEVSLDPEFERTASESFIMGEAFPFDALHSDQERALVAAGVGIFLFSWASTGGPLGNLRGKATMLAWNRLHFLSSIDIIAKRCQEAGLKTGVRWMVSSF